MRILTILFDDARSELFESVRKILRGIKSAQTVLVTVLVVLAMILCTIGVNVFENNKVRVVSYLEAKATVEILRRMPRPEKREPKLPVPIPEELRRLIEILLR